MRALVVAVAATVVTACSGGSKSKPAVVAGCDYGDGLCTSGAGMTAATCEAGGGTFVASGCPSASRVGTCTTSQQGQTVVMSFYSPVYSTADGAEACAGLSGTWTPASGGGTGGGTTTSVRCLWAGDQCWQVTGSLTEADKADIDALCAGMQGTYAAAPCDTASTVAGYCFYADAGWSGASEKDYYYTASWTLAAAQADCADWEGAWTAN